MMLMMRSPVARSIATSPSPGSSVLPLLDIRQYDSNRKAFTEELRVACHQNGFFLLRHDIPARVVDAQMAVTRSFFAQSLAEKNKISYMDSPAFRGYMPMGVENTSGRTDLREQMEFAVQPLAARRNEAPHQTVMWPPYRRLQGYNPWPSPRFEKSTMEYVMHSRRIADCVRNALFDCLQLEASQVEELFGKGTENNEEPHWVVKMISYPSILKTPETEGSFGVGPHTDSNFLTLVLQDNVGGLQVFSQGDWVDVPTLENVLVCNLGEQAQILSRGYFLATPHRVLANDTPPANEPPRPRVSVPLFYNPLLSAAIRPMDQLPAALPWERPQDYDSTQHWKRTNNAMLTTVGDNTFKSLARSHPKVFAKHHSDLELLADGRIVKRQTT